MENPVQQQRVESAEMSVIGQGITITGNIEADVDLHLQGKVHGDVRCATLILSETSLIKGSVFAERVRAAGTVEGSIETIDLAVEATARIIGDVTYSRIKIANGGIVHGQMAHKPAADEAADGSKLRLVEPEPQPQRAKGAGAVYIE
jgi:cytoskeletal protein CcmA (bactofilin family)